MQTRVGQQLPNSNEGRQPPVSDTDINKDNVVMTCHSVLFKIFHYLSRARASLVFLLRRVRSPTKFRAPIATRQCVKNARNA